MSSDPHGMLSTPCNGVSYKAHDKVPSSKYIKWLYGYDSNAHVKRFTFLHKLSKSINYNPQKSNVEIHPLCNCMLLACTTYLRTE